jgi:PAS domain S-box-containing protein
LAKSPLYQAFQDAISSQNYVCVDFYFSEKDKWLEVHVYPSANGLSVFMRDVSEERKIKYKLESSERHYRALIEKSSEAIVVLNENGKILYQSPATQKISGYTLEEMNAIDGIDVIHPQDRKADQECFMEVVQSPGRSIERTHRLRHKNGHYIWIEGTYYNLLFDPSVKGIVYNYHDVTKRVEAEAEAVNVTRLYQLISQVNHTIIRVKQEQSLYDDVCKIATELGLFQMTWIGMIDETETKIVPVSHSGDVNGYLNSMKQILLNDEILGCGPTGTAIRTGRYYVCNDILADPKMSPWREDASARGFRSSISLPIILFEKPIGIFVLYSGEANYFNNQEVTLLEEMTANISFCIETIEKDRRRVKAEAEVAKVYKEKETTLNRISDSVISVNESWKYTFLNDAALSTHPLAKYMGCSCRPTRNSI